MNPVWKIEFKTRISGYAKIAYYHEYVLIAAPTSKEAANMFSSLIMRTQYGTYGLVGSELKTWYKPTLSTDVEGDIQNIYLKTFYEKKVHTSEDIERLQEENKARKENHPEHYI